MEYRREIDGLRALAVLPVIFFHAGLPGFSGGFVGVDVFFVISGYLITSIIISEINSQSFSILNFYERRARRLLPALYLVMLCCIPWAWLWLLPADFIDFGESLFAVSVFLSNQLFLIESGYFDAVAELKPLLHTWSLAVEEQFYLLFPPILLLLARFRWRLLWPTLIVLSLTCLAYAEYALTQRPAAAFFLLISRGWELIVGASLVFLNPYLNRLGYRHVVFQVGALAGVLMIAGSVLVFDHRTQFPGLCAMVPTLGAALLILFAQPSTTIGRVLSHQSLVSIGLLSYSAYLWHQPIFAFARHVNLSEPARLTMIVLICLVFVLAYLTWRFVERPFRSKNSVTRQSVLLVFLVGTVFFLSFGWMVHTGSIQGHIRLDKSLTGSFKGHDLRQSCDDGKGHSEGQVPFCILGNPARSDPRIAVFGDSHSDALNPLFDMLGKNHDFSYVHNGIGGCPGLLGVDVAKGNWGAGVCRKIADQQFEYVKKRSIKTVFLVSRWSLYTQGEYGKSMTGYFLTNDDSKEFGLINSRMAFVKGLKDTVQAYQSLGVQVIIVLQVPQQKIEPQKLYAKLSTFIDFKNDEAMRLIEKFSISKSDHLQLQEFNRAFFEGLRVTNGVTLVNPDPFYCDEMRCLLGSPRAPYFNDDDHVSSTGALRLEPAIYKALWP